MFTYVYSLFFTEYEVNKIIQSVFLNNCVGIKRSVSCGNAYISEDRHLEQSVKKKATSSVCRQNFVFFGVALLPMKVSRTILLTTEK